MIRKYFISQSANYQFVKKNDIILKWSDYFVKYFRISRRLKKTFPFHEIGNRNHTFTKSSISRRRGYNI